MQIVASQALLSGKQAPAVSGVFTPRQSLDKILSGSGLTPRFEGSSVVIKESQAAGESTLAAVTVTAEANTAGLANPYAGGQLARGGKIGVLGTLDIMDTPFSTTNYTSKLIENQQARSVADVVVNDASVRALTAAGGFGDQFQIRGFTVSNEDTGMNGLFGLTSTTRIPLEMIERVEVIKGPGTLINGIAPSGSIGGSINLVTKRASDDPLTRLTTSYISAGQAAVHADIGRRFGEDKAWGVRVNSLMRNGEGTIDGGRQQIGLVTLGLDYRGSNLRWSLDAMQQRDSMREFRPQTSVAAAVTQIPSAPDARTNFYPGTKLDYENSTLLSKFEYDISKDLMIYGGVGYTDFSYEQSFPSAVGGVQANGNFTARNAYYDFTSKTTVANVGVRKQFTTGPIGHTVVLAADRSEQETGYFYATSPTTASSNIYTPSSLPGMTASRTAPQKSAENSLTSYALTDTLAFADDRVLLTLGVRDQKVEQLQFNQATGAVTSTYSSSAVSPVAGLVIKPQSNVSVYGNYTEGLTRGSIVSMTSGYANPGEVLAPYKSKQGEVGVKVDWGKIITSASIFQIERPNAEINPGSNRYDYFGEQRNRGLELLAFGEIQRGLRMMASTVFNDSLVSSVALPANDGKKAVGVPDRTFNLGVDWDTPWVAGLSLNGRVIKNSSAYYNGANTVSVPGWTRYDIGARYLTSVAGKATTLRATVENLFDKNYWLQSGTYLTVAAPRTALLSATVDF
jgi:iron complex outermembrane receptor protein